MATNSRGTAIAINVNPLSEMADRVGQLDTKAIADAAVTALNETIDSAYEMSRERITVGINLSDDYLRRKMTVEHATGKKLEASITAAGDKASMTRLVSYNAQMLIVPRKTTRPSRATGALPIPTGVGAKQGGVRVSVTRGEPKVMATAFMLPLRKGAAAGDKRGVFIRTGDRLKHLMGPSVYQLFGYQANRMKDEVADALQEAVSVEMDAHIEKVFG